MEAVQDPGPLAEAARLSHPQYSHWRAAVLMFDTSPHQSTWSTHCKASCPNDYHFVTVTPSCAIIGSMGVEIDLCQTVVPVLSCTTSTSLTTVLVAQPDLEMERFGQGVGVQQVDLLVADV